MGLLALLLPGLTASAKRTVPVIRRGVKRGVSREIGWGRARAANPLTYAHKPGMRGVLCLQKAPRQIVVIREPFGPSLSREPDSGVSTRRGGLLGVSGPRNRPRVRRPGRPPVGLKMALWPMFIFQPSFVAAKVNMLGRYSPVHGTSQARLGPIPAIHRVIHTKGWNWAWRGASGRRRRVSGGGSRPGPRKSPTLPGEPPHFP